jgi:hypothetical protein
MSFFNKLDKHSDLMGGMAEKVGVDWSELLVERPDLANQYRTAVLSCTHCRDVGECQGWQATHEKAEETPDYCRNKDLLEKLASA